MARPATLALLLLAGSAAAGDDPYGTWRDAVRAVERRQKDYWDEFQRRFHDALVAFAAPIREAGGPEGPANPTYDFSGIRALYAEYAALEREKGAADRAFAATGDARAFNMLSNALLDLGRDVAKLEKEILDARPKSRSRFDQRPAVERHALEFRRDALVAALAVCPRADAGLAGEAWRDAERRDGKDSVYLRAAVIDALALCDTPPAREALARRAEARHSSVRAAAAEALVRYGAEARPALVPLLADESPVVRRTLLEAIAARPGDPGWIGPVLESYRDATGLLRADHVRALEALTNQRYGDAPQAWAEWFADYRPEIEGGSFDRDAIEVREVEREEPAMTCSFYGIATPSRGIVFVLESSKRLGWPADLEVQLTAYKEDWHRRRQTWEDEHRSHHAVLTREFELATGSLPETARFGVVALYGSFQTEVLGGRRLLRAARRDLRRARTLLEKLPADGWCAPYEGLLRAAALAGMGPGQEAHFEEPRADTVFLWDAGAPVGGRYMDAEAVVAAFRRFNRFRRLVVHTIRICDEGEAAEAVMKGIAEASGGRYVWAKKP